MGRPSKEHRTRGVSKEKHLAVFTPQTLDSCVSAATVTWFVSMFCLISELFILHLLQQCLQRTQHPALQTMDFLCPLTREKVSSFCFRIFQYQ